MYMIIYIDVGYSRNTQKMSEHVMSINHKIRKSSVTHFN